MDRFPEGQELRRLLLAALDLCQRHSLLPSSASLPSSSSSFRGSRGRGGRVPPTASSQGGGGGGMMAEEEVRKLWFAPLDVLLRGKARAKVRGEKGVCWCRMAVILWWRGRNGRV